MSEGLRRNVVTALQVRPPLTLRRNEPTAIWISRRCSLFYYRQRCLGQRGVSFLIVREATKTMVMEDGESSWEHPRIDLD